MPGSTSSSSAIRRFVDLLADERADVGLVYFYAALAGVLGLSVPLGVQAIIGLVSGGLLLQPVIVLIGLVVLGTFAAGAVQVVQLGVVERLQQRLFARHALELARDLPHVDHEAIPGTDLPELTNRFFEIITIQKSLAKLLTESVAALLAILAGLVLLTFYHPYLSLFGAVLVVALAGTLWLTGKSGLATSLAESGAKYSVAHWLQELARHGTVFHASAATTLPVQRMDREVEEYLVQRQAHFRVIARQSMAVVFMKTLVTGGLLVLGAMLVVDRRISLGQFVASELVIVSVLAGVEKLIFSLSTVYDALTAAQKSGQLRELPLVDDRETHAAASYAAVGLPTQRDARDAQRTGMTVELSQLRYQYAGQPLPVLEDITMSVQAGERVALVGSEGAGSSTLLRIIAGLQRDYHGGLALDGASMRDLPRSSVRGALSMVGPHASLFDGTLEDNITLGDHDLTSADIARALALAGLSEYVRMLPAGLQTRVGPSGALPSHVLRNVMLARGIVSRPRLLMFDEFFHHIEPAARGPLITRLCDRDAGWTVIAASHDPAFLAACDRVLLLDRGRLVAEGSYDAMRDELVERRLVRAQPVVATFTDEHAVTDGDA